jgi:DNA-binding beta-propeller fold protein YncE
VNGIANGNATVGTISSTGLYTAPITRPISASGAVVPIVFAIANAAIPNSGLAGSVIELQSGSDFANFAPGNTINITGNSVAGWNGSFIIVAAALLQNGNLGVQIGTPAGPPANGVGGTATATPNITVTAQVQSTNAAASATITLDSGIRVSLSQPTCTIGTNETFSFAPLVSVTGTSTTTVTWSVSGVGSIDPNSGLYMAPDAAGTATVTATSTADPTEHASATVTIVTAADPTFTSLSPPTGALGAAFLEVYLTGSNFICTTAVLVNNGVTNASLPANFISTLSSTTLLITVPDSILATLPASGTTVTLTFTVERQGGAPISCSACQVVLSPVRPALVAATPDSIPLPSGVFNLTLDGGYFGSTNTAAGVQGTAVVNVQFSGQANATPTFISDRELVVAVPASDVATGPGTGPGLYPITVANKVSGSTNGSVAAANLAVQPIPTFSATGGMPVNVGANPSSIAIDTAMGVAVVANQGSNDITLVSLGTLTTPALRSLTPSLCTGSIGTFSTPCVATTAPVSVAVDNIRNLALVANSANSTLAVVNLGNPTATPPTAPKITALLNFPAADANGNPLPLAPQAVGINPVTGRALVAFSTSAGIGGSNAGAILDMNQVQAAQGVVTLPAAPPAAPILINVVNLNNGPKPHIAVSARLNWALSTPGGVGSLAVVDLGRQTISQINTLTCSSNAVTVSTASIVSLLAGQPVLISGATPASLNGIFQVTSVSGNTFTFAQRSCNSGSGGAASFALPVAILATNPNVRGVSINDETEKALLVDPTAGLPAFVFNILDQTSLLVQGLPSGTSTTNNVAAAMDPLTNVGVILNTGGQAFVVDPTTPTAHNLTFSAGASPVDVAVDPATNTAIVVNSGTPGSVSLFSLGGLRSAPQIIQSSFTPAQSSSSVTINSSLFGSTVTAQDQIVTLVGRFTNTSPCGMTGDCPRLDGDPSPFTGVSIASNGREMTATLPGSFLASHGPRLYALDVTDSSAPPAILSNAAPLQVIQAVSLVTGDCSNPAAQGVAIDAVHSVALVTEPGCNGVSMVSLANSTGFPVGTGFGAQPELAVGTNPQGVAVYPQTGLAVAANAGSNNVSIVDIVNDAVPTTFTTDPIPSGVAIDLGTGQAVVTASGASVVDHFPVSTTAQTPTTIGVQQGPTGVAIDPRNHVAVVANSSSNTASILSLSSNTATSTTSSIIFPQGVAFDPISGSFLITSGATNQVIVLNPNTVSTPAIRVGIAPSSIAYNFESGTLVTGNNLSGTMTVVDFIDRTVRGIFSLRSSTQFGVDIHPQTNLAVVADPVDNQLLLVPLPH